MDKWIKMGSIKRMKFIPFDHDSKKDIGSGCYRLKDKNNKIVYVGKSKDVHERLSNHLAGNTHTKYFIDEVRSADWIQETEYESLLESILIAYFKPKYNDEVKN